MFSRFNLVEVCDSVEKEYVPGNLKLERLIEGLVILLSHTKYSCQSDE